MVGEDGLGFLGDQIESQLLIEERVRGSRSGAMACGVCIFALPVVWFVVDVYFLRSEQMLYFSRGVHTVLIGISSALLALVSAGVFALVGWVLRRIWLTGMDWQGWVLAGVASAVVIFSSTVVLEESRVVDDSDGLFSMLLVLLFVALVSCAVTQGVVGLLWRLQQRFMDGGGR